jgi:mono/diheme cytochrome c family protein
MRSIAPLLVLAALLGGCASFGPGSARQDAASGQRFAERACAGCHAIGPSGESPDPRSPPFRTLAERLPGPALEAELTAIAGRGHVQMPPIYMTPGEIRAVAAYIRAAAPRTRS